MTQLLDILSDYLEISSLGYSRLDGTMSYFDRELEVLDIPTNHYPLMLCVFNRWLDFVMILIVMYFY